MIMCRWTEYVEELFTGKIEYEARILENLKKRPSNDLDGPTIDSISTEEVEKAIRKWKNKKSVGIGLDGILANR
jgi:hypothetical protein